MCMENKTQTETEKVLSLDLNNISLADLKWLHDLKNKAFSMQSRLQLKHAEGETL